MNSGVLKLVAGVTVVLALILAIAGYRVSRQFAETATQAAQQAPAALPQTLAVVALKPIAAYAPIPREAVALVPVAIAPKDYYTSLDEVAGRVPLTDVDAGAPVTQRYFKEGNALARVIPPGFQALALEINEVVATGGFVRPGDIVDVLVYLRGGSGGVEQPQARVLLESARVLAYEDRIIDRPEGLKEADGGPDERRRRVRTAVLAVPEGETTRVMLGASLGDVRLSLRAQDVATTPEAREAGAPAKPGDKAVTAAELARVKPAVEPRKAPPPPPPKITIYRGSQTETVTE